MKFQKFAVSFTVFTFLAQKTYFAALDFGRFCLSNQAYVVEYENTKIISVHFPPLFGILEPGALY